MILKEILSSLYYPVRIPEMPDFLSNFLVTHFHFFSCAYYQFEGGMSLGNSSVASCKLHGQEITSRRLVLHSFQQ